MHYCINILAGLGIVPEFNATFSATSRYGDYLEGVYSRSSVSSDGKFPPTPSNTYVKLALINKRHGSEIRDLEEVRENTLHGRVDEMFKGKTKIELADILKPHDNGRPVSLVLVLGPPGIGKSTLAWELCRRWDRNQYDLAVLLRLREREVQQIVSIADLFPHENKQLRQSVAEEVLSSEGMGVLFILDGYDELPIYLRHQGLLIKLLGGKVLPRCSVLVTSRPSANRDFSRVCRPQIQRRVEILGFNQESVKEYASSIFSSEPEVLKDFLTYISASKNPAINSLMYIPLNAAIIVEIYKNTRKDCPIPITMTQVYTQLCLTILQRYLDINPDNTDYVDSFCDLPSTYYDHFKQLTLVAFEQFEQQKIVFYSKDVPKGLVHFGFLDSVPALYGGGGVSYNFLHLTLQEFLAAYHITQLPNGIDVFKRHSEDRRWEVVWRFVSGLTGFQFFLESVRCAAFVSPLEDEYCIKNFLLHCLFEGQLMFDYMAVLGMSKLYQSDQLCSSPLDRYALGHCIANCSSATSWKVHIREGSGESFMWGLNSNDRGKGVIRHLEIISVLLPCLDSFPTTILSGIVHLKISEFDAERFQIMVEVLPLMKSLSSLFLAGRAQDSPDLQMGPKLIHAISETNVTTLTMLFEFLSDQTFLSSLYDLINSPSNSIKDLSLELSEIGSIGTKPFCDILFGPSSLNHLTLGLPYFTENSFDLLETNTSLITVDIAFFDSCTLQLKSLSKILKRNKTIEKLEWACLSKLADLDFFVQQAEDLNLALSLNTTLKKLILHMETHHEYQKMRDSSLSLISDTRVKYDLSHLFDELASPPSFLTSVSPSMF